MNVISFLRFLLLIIFIFGFINITACENVKKSIDDNQDDENETTDDAKDSSLDIATENENNNITCTRRQNSLMHAIQVANKKQFPFMAAIMSHQHEYLCAGSVVSNGLILTTAQCTLQPISYVLLNTTRAKKDENSMMLHITKSEKFPSFTGSDSLRDIGIIYTKKLNNSVASKIKLSNLTNSRNIIDLEGIGFGLNADVGQTKELQYVGMEHRSLIDVGDVINGYFDCVDTKVPTCFKDTGGPVIYDNELIGVITKGQNECTKEMSSQYAVNKRMVDALPTYVFKSWLDEKIKKNEEQDTVALVTYPSKPVVREQPLQRKHKMTMGNAGYRLSYISVFVVFIVYLVYSVL